MQIRQEQYSTTTGGVQLRIIAEQMMALFPTNSRCHATYDPKKLVTREGGKIVPKYVTVHEPVTPELWEGHLAGTYPLVAALACDDCTTKVSVIDIDEYFDINIIEIARKIKSLGLPLYVRQSKSGGAHVYAFHAIPISIAVSVKVSRGMARLLGYSDKDKKVEHFPRVQDQDVNPRQLNMPFLGDNGEFLNETGGAVTVEDFLGLVCFLTDEQRASIIKTKEPRKSQPTGVDAGRNYARGKLRRYVSRDQRW